MCTFKYVLTLAEEPLTPQQHWRDKCVVFDKDPGEDLLTCESTIARVDLRGPFQSGTSVVDPGSGAFLTSGSGMIFFQIPDLESQIPDPKAIFLRDLFILILLSVG